MFILGNVKYILGVDFKTKNKMFITRHNRLVRVPCKHGLVCMKAYVKVFSVGKVVIHLMSGQTWKKQIHGRVGHVMCDAGRGWG
jgi:hypothetical protein